MDTGRRRSLTAFLTLPAGLALAATGVLPATAEGPSPAEEPAPAAGTSYVALGDSFSAGTGTRRGHRGRGLAKLAKNDSLHRARAAGYTEAFTGNDLGNGPMLAVNKWFGYVRCATERRMVRELGL